MAIQALCELGKIDAKSNGTDSRLTTMRMSAFAFRDCLFRAARSLSPRLRADTRCCAGLLADIAERHDNEMPAYHDSMPAQPNSGSAERVTATVRRASASRAS